MRSTNQRRAVESFSELEISIFESRIFNQKKMTRQIKRTRQIEDFVIEKLARRGLISEKEKENSAQFVKGKGDS